MLCARTASRLASGPPGARHSRRVTAARGSTRPVARTAALVQGACSRLLMLSHTRWARQGRFFSPFNRVYFCRNPPRMISSSSPKLTRRAVAWSGAFLTGLPRMLKTPHTTHTYTYTCGAARARFSTAHASPASPRAPPCGVTCALRRPAAAQGCETSSAGAIVRAQEMPRARLKRAPPPRMG